MTMTLKQKFEKLMDEHGLMYILLALEEIASYRAHICEKDGEDENALKWRKISHMTLDFNAEQIKLEVARKVY